jgi:hypothetical protein
MLTFIKQNKLLSIVAALFIFGITFYTFTSSGGNSGSSALLNTSDVSNSAASQQLLVTLANLHTIRLDGTIFNDPVYLSLTDYGVVIAPENVGRRNPFVPFSGTSTPQVNLGTSATVPVSGSIPGTNPPTPRVRVFPAGQ